MNRGGDTKMTNHPNRSRTRWIDADYDNQIGEIGFLVTRQNNIRGWTKTHVSQSPAHGNMDHMPHLKGWCGTTNDVAVYAEGLARIEQFSKNGERAKVRLLNPAETAEALEDLGYPELAS